MDVPAQSFNHDDKIIPSQGSEFHEQAFRERQRIIRGLSGAGEALAAKTTIEDLKPFPDEVAASILSELEEFRVSLDEAARLKRPVTKCENLLREVEEGASTTRVGTILSRYSAGIKEESREHLFELAKIKIQMILQELKHPLVDKIEKIKSQVEVISSLVATRDVSSSHAKKNLIYSLVPDSDCLKGLRANSDQEFEENRMRLIDIATTSIAYVKGLQEGTLLEANCESISKIQAYEEREEARASELRDLINSSELGKILSVAKDCATKGFRKWGSFDEYCDTRSKSEIEYRIRCLTQETCLKAWNRNGQNSSIGEQIEGVTSRKILEYLAREPDAAIAPEEEGILFRRVEKNWKSKKIPEKLSELLGEKNLEGFNPEQVRPKNLDLLIEAAGENFKTKLLIGMLLPDQKEILTCNLDETKKWIEDIKLYLNTFDPIAFCGERFLELFRMRPGKTGFLQNIKLFKSHIDNAKTDWRKTFEWGLYEEVPYLAKSLEVRPEVVFLGLNLYYGVVAFNIHEISRLSSMHRTINKRIKFTNDELLKFLDHVGLRRHIGSNTHYYTQAPQNVPPELEGLWRAITNGFEAKAKYLEERKPAESKALNLIEREKFILKISELPEVIKSLLRIAPPLHSFLRKYAAIENPDKVQQIDKDTLKALRRDFLKVLLAEKDKKRDTKLESSVGRASPIDMMKVIARLNPLDPSSYDYAALIFHGYTLDEFKTEFGDVVGESIHSGMRYFADRLHPALSKKRFLIDDVAAIIEMIVDPKSETYRQLIGLHDAIKSLKKARSK